jgi:hypothetical protein
VRFENQDLSGALFQNVNLSGARFREAMLVNVRMSGLIHGLVINDIEVAPLIAAEMNRRYPERAKLKPQDVPGVRIAWAVCENLWSASKARASALPEPLLHERVDDEWSFLETMRHLVMVTDAWIGVNVLGRSGQFHPFGVVPSFITEPPPEIDVNADPSFDEVVSAREDRMNMVRAVITGLSDAALDEEPHGHTVRHCLWTLFDEEWHHNWFANRDLDVLTSAG